MEIWDLYDNKRNIIGTHIRGNQIPDNTYHLVVHVWIKNSKGQYLIAQRSKSRTQNPLLWECVGGSALKGENSLTTALREVKEEVGIVLSPDNGKLIFTEIRNDVDHIRFNDILDVWCFEYNGPVCLKQATTNEVEQIKWLYPKEILTLYQTKKLVWTLKYFFYIISKIK